VPAGTQAEAAHSACVESNFPLVFTYYFLRTKEVSMSGSKHHHSPNKKKHTTSHGAGSAEVDEAMGDINTEAQNEGIRAVDEIFPQENFHAGDLNEEDTAAHKETAEEAASTFQNEERQKIHLEFYGSDILREKAPKVMDIADKVADEWIADGSFESVQIIENPLAQHFAAKALRKAKDVEKKLDEKGVFMMAKIGVDYAKSKLHKK
jgi:hypothetical protein